MSVDSSTDILVLSNIQAKALAGSVLAIGEEVYRLKDYDPAYPGQPPWRSGAEGKAYPLLGRDGSVVAYLKFFTRPTQKRLNRTAWLIGQQMHTWLPGSGGRPFAVAGHSAGLPFRGDRLRFCRIPRQAVPGETWLELKNQYGRHGAFLPRRLPLAMHRRPGAGHCRARRDGHHSRRLVTRTTSSSTRLLLPDEPALYLIDFDAFVAPAAGPYQALDVAAGGTYGTEGYCPPELAARAARGTARRRPIPTAMDATC